MRCRSALTRIDALRTGELRRDEHVEVEKHLRTCRSCDASVDDVDGLARAVKSLSVAPLRSCRDSVVVTDSFDRLDGDTLAPLKSSRRSKSDHPDNTIWVAFSDRGLRMIHRGGSAAEFRSLYAKRYGRTLEQAPIPDRLRRQVVGALTGAGVEKPQVDLGTPSELEEKVLTVLSRIPRGEVRTYSWVAQQIGRPSAVRAVANVVARNVVPFVIPCHRVVPAAGGVGQYAFGSPAKRELLRREGVDVEQLDALARKGVRLIGSRTTNIVCFPTCRDARRIREENRVPFHEAEEAVQKGFRPCRRCQPFMQKGMTA
jgi:O-6-methylguanine DNA methyltransferase